MAANAKLPAMPPLPLRTVIISGGPTPDYNQYAIESNARYLEKLTETGRSQAIYFADGSKKSKTISMVDRGPDYTEEQLLAWLLDTDEPADRMTLKAPQLKRLDGPATRLSTLQALEKLSRQIRPGENALVYFTGHGGNSYQEWPTRVSFGKTPSGSDYALWGTRSLTVPEMAATLRKWPSKVPLSVVMVQCHSGGFGDLIFQDADPRNPVTSTDMSGFFASTADRQSSGCTSEVDEEDYEDFTTHFFAALSGRTRYGTLISGMDYDGNKRTSMLEAYAWAIVHDDSIDVPVCTSDIYLRSIGPDRDNSWLHKRYSELLKKSAPWQKAIFNGLSQRLGLTGERRLNQAWSRHEAVQKIVESDKESKPRDWDAVLGADADRASAVFWDMEARIKKLFPDLKRKPGTPAYKTAKARAIRWLKQRPAEVKILKQASARLDREYGRDAVQEAQLWRFLRSARTVMLEQWLAREGTPTQKAVFARLRRAESRNPLHQ